MCQQLDLISGFNKFFSDDAIGAPWGGSSYQSSNIPSAVLRTEPLTNLVGSESSFEPIPTESDPWTMENQNMMMGSFGAPVPQMTQTPQMTQMSQMGQTPQMQGGMLQGQTLQSIGGFGQMQQQFNGLSQMQGQAPFSET